jgi:N-methylhydantoinase B/oxoprolinase/acetone carboxylase alpha subunit
VETGDVLTIETPGGGGFGKMNENIGQEGTEVAENTSERFSSSSAISAASC